MQNGDTGAFDTEVSGSAVAQTHETDNLEIVKSAAVMPRCDIWALRTYTANPLCSYLAPRKGHVGAFSLWQTSGSLCKGEGSHLRQAKSYGFCSKTRRLDWGRSRASARPGEWQPRSRAARRPASHPRPWLRPPVLMTWWQRHENVRAECRAGRPGGSAPRESQLHDTHRGPFPSVSVGAADSTQDGE